MPDLIRPTTQVTGTRERRSFDVPLRSATSRAFSDTKNLTMDIRASTGNDRPAPPVSSPGPRTRDAPSIGPIA